jgi:hypothetical protein
MNEDEIIKRVISKRDFSMIPTKDILLAYKKFERRECSDEEKIRLTRDLLRKVYSAFVSGKLLSIKDKDEGWFLRKHLSTRERISYYSQVYARIFLGIKKCSVVDLGSGINGFSYNFLPKGTNYLAIEGVGQLVDLMNFYFKKNNLNADAKHESLFNLDKIKKLIEGVDKPRVVFLFKVIDSLEMIESDYSKRLLNEVVPLCERVVVSFATRSMIKKEKFKVNRKWIVDFIKENFELLDDFEIGGERYLSFSGKFKFK